MDFLYMFFVSIICGGGGNRTRVRNLIQPDDYVCIWFAVLVVSTKPAKTIHHQDPHPTERPKFSIGFQLRQGSNRILSLLS